MARTVDTGWQARRLSWIVQSMPVSKKGLFIR